VIKVSHRQSRKITRRHVIFSSKMSLLFVTSGPRHSILKVVDEPIGVCLERVGRLSVGIEPFPRSTDMSIPKLITLSAFGGS
jgi:hypothetical protein